jgi:PPOX class probable F420-dependent enzyme
MPSFADIPPIFLEQPTCVLATVFPDGTPQLTPVWFIVEDGSIAISARNGRKKIDNLRTHDRGSVLIYHPDSDFAYVEIRGTVEVIDDNDYAFADRLGPPKYNTDMRSFDPPDSTRVKLALTPEKVVLFDHRS